MAAWRKTGRLERHRTRLLQGFMERGISLEFGERLYEQIKGFGEYGFPESHAASFAILVYASSWLKTHHPAFFACALLNSLPMGFYAPAQIVADAQRHDVTVRKADVNESDWDSTIEAEGGALRLGLRLVKGLREDVGRRVAEERKARGPYRDVSDIVRRCDLDKRARDVLSRAGALDSLAVHRRAAVWTALDKRPVLLRGLADEDVGGVLPPPSDREILLLDYATTGVSVDDHPMLHLRPALLSMPWAKKGSRILDSREVQQTPHGTKARAVGLVIGRQRPGTADGTCFVTLEDEHGMVNVIVWGRDFDRWRQTVVTAQFLLVDGVIERQGIVVHMIAHKVTAVSPAHQAELPFKSRDFH
jgi:error-prone DNA polymerase